MNGCYTLGYGYWMRTNFDFAFSCKRPEAALQKIMGPRHLIIFTIIGEATMLIDNSGYREAALVIFQ